MEQSRSTAVTDGRSLAHATPTTTTPLLRSAAWLGCFAFLASLASCATPVAPPGDTGPVPTPAEPPRATLVFPDIQPGMTRDQVARRYALAWPPLLAVDGGHEYRGHVLYRIEIDWDGDTAARVRHVPLDGGGRW